MQKTRLLSTLFEAILILVTALALSLLYNTLSPRSIRLLPPKKLQKDSPATGAVNPASHFRTPDFSYRRLA